MPITALKLPEPPDPHVGGRHGPRGGHADHGIETIPVRGRQAQSFVPEGAMPITASKRGSDVS